MTSLDTVFVNPPKFAAAEAMYRFSLLFLYLQLVCTPNKAHFCHKRVAALAVELHMPLLKMEQN